MKYSLLLFTILFTKFSFAQQQILLFSKTAGWRHDSIEIAVKQITSYAKKNKIKVIATEDAGLFTPHNLKQYKTVVFLLTTGEVLNSEQQKAFETYIQQGGGFVGVHSAADTEYDWPWYNKLVGGYFNGHPNQPNVRSASLTKVDHSHPATNMLANKWQHTDEWYDYKDFNPEVTVLINVNESSYKRAEEKPIPYPRPIAWYHNYQGGKAFYTGLGHTKEAYSNPLFMDHLWGGIKWAMK